MTTESNVFDGPFGGSSSAIVNALGYTPANRAGDTFTGPITLAAGGAVFSGGSALVNDGTNTVALKNGTAGQVWRVYGTTSGYGYMSVASANTMDIGHSAGNLGLGGNGNRQWLVASAGNFVFQGSSNITALDIGPTGGGSLTGSNAQSLVSLAQTWNTSGVPTLIKANVTNSASGAGALLLDLQVAAVSKFKVDLTGTIKQASGGQLWTGNALVTGLTPATVAALLTKSIILYDVAGNPITIYGS